MFHTVAFFGSQGAGALNDDLPALQDAWLTIQNNHFILPEQMKVLMAYGLGATITNARLNTPSFRLVSLPSVQPVEVGAAVPSLPHLAEYRDHEPVVPPIDEFAFETSNGAGAPENHWALVWLQFGNNINSTPGPVFTVRATGTITAVANTWTQGAITLDQTLPAGRYDVVGMSVVGANLVAARLVLPRYKHRPGCLARVAVANDDWNRWRMGRIGRFGDFDSYAQPQLDILANGANTAQTVFLDLVKMS